VYDMFNTGVYSIQLDKTTHTQQQVYWPFHIPRQTSYRSAKMGHLQVRFVKYSCAQPWIWQKKPWFPQGALVQLKTTVRSSTTNHVPVAVRATL
jgi:hypothetical protein